MSTASTKSRYYKLCTYKNRKNCITYKMFTQFHITFVLIPAEFMMMTNNEKKYERIFIVD